METRRTKLGGNIPPTRQTLARFKDATIQEADEDHTSESKATEHQKMLQISLDLEGMRREQHNMITKQEKNYGTTIDTIDGLQAELDKAKLQNSDLITEMKSERERLGQLQSHFEELQQKFQNYQNTLKSMRREKEFWEDSKSLLVQTDEKCKRLTTSNRHLRALLIKHHIDPDVDANTMGTSIHIRKPQTERKAINAVSPRSRLSERSITWRN